jgi:hypothetical protein
MKETLDIYYITGPTSTATFMRARAQFKTLIPCTIIHHAPTLIAPHSTHVRYQESKSKSGGDLILQVLLLLLLLLFGAWRNYSKIWQRLVLKWADKKHNKISFKIIVFRATCWLLGGGRGSRPTEAWGQGATTSPPPQPAERTRLISPIYTPSAIMCVPFELALKALQVARRRLKSIPAIIS